MTSRSLLHSSLTIRLADADDGPDLDRMAELDSARVPAGRVLLAIVDGRLLAARSLETGAVIADPFVRTAELTEILADRAARVHAAARRDDHRHVLRSATARLRRSRRTSAA